MQRFFRLASNRAPAAWGVVILLPVLAGGALLATRPADALLPQAADNTTFTLQRIFKPGDSARYKFVVHNKATSAEAGAQELEITFTTRYKETVKEVKPDGSAVLQDEFEKAVGTFNMQDLDLISSMPKVTQTFDKKGQLVSVKMDGGNEQINGALTQMFQALGRAQAYYPTQPIKPGDTWKIDLSNPSTPDEKTTGTATFVGPETAAGMQTLKIKVATDAKLKVPTDMPGNMTDATVHFEGTVNADPKTGQIVRLSGQGNSEAAGLGKNKVDLNLMLLKGNETGDEKTDTPQTDSAGKPTSKP